MKLRSWAVGLFLKESHTFLLYLSKIEDFLHNSNNNLFFFYYSFFNYLLTESQYLFSLGILSACNLLQEHMFSYKGQEEY